MPGSSLGMTNESGSLHQIDRVVLDHRVRQQLGAHLIDFGLGLGLVAFLEVDLDELALAHVADRCEAERVEGVGDGASLGIEDAVLEGNVDAGFHDTPSVSGWTITASPLIAWSRGPSCRAGRLPGESPGGARLPDRPLR